MGKTGRLNGRVGPGRVGEVMLSVRGGAEAFYAYAYTRGEEIETGTQVVVMEYEAPRTVFVAPLP